MEVCIDNFESATNAIKGGASRLEVCSALSEGGLTPSYGLLLEIRSFCGSEFPLFAMIRPRGGHFNYTETELRIMEVDIENLKSAGADGFVFGLLKRDHVDMEGCKRLLKKASPLPCTFHRAFDKLSDSFQAVETIIELGFSRILTSGCELTADEGKELIAKLIQAAGNRIIIMPGAGINPQNLLPILEATDATQFHGSAKKSEDGDYFFITNEQIVRIMVEIFEKYHKAKKSIINK